MNMLLWALGALALIGAGFLYLHAFYKESHWLEGLFRAFLPWADELHEIARKEEDTFDH